jgi:ribosomal protein L11 methyltransferase
MFSLEILCSPDHLELLIAELWEQGCAGISELDGVSVRAFFDDTADRELLRQRYPEAAMRLEEERDWVESARDLFQPLAVGARFFLVPEWRDDPAPPGRFRIIVNPGLAFGTGVHETTQLMLEALESYVRRGMTVLDVGTGSGILGEAAGLLGAERVFACDSDPEAIEVARQRLACCFVGSIGAVRPGIADLTLANISPEAITDLAPDLVASLRTGGVLLASGFETNEVEEVVEVLGAYGQVRDVVHKGKWALATVYSP